MARWWHRWPSWNVLNVEVGRKMDSPWWSSRATGCKFAPYLCALIRQYNFPVKSIQGSSYKVIALPIQFVWLIYFTWELEYFGGLAVNLLWFCTIPTKILHALDFDYILFDCPLSLSCYMSTLSNFTEVRLPTLPKRKGRKKGRKRVREFDDWLWLIWSGCPECPTFLLFLLIKL